MEEKRYFGTKLVRAIPQAKNGEPGYRVTYEHGYVSWSPSDVFDGCYQAIDEGMDFGHAIAALRAGWKVKRIGWNGPGQFLGLQFPDENSAKTGPYIWIRTTQGVRVPWVASQTDMLAGDWVVELDQGDPSSSPG